MEDIISILIKSFGEELDFINKLIKIVEFWEKKMYFSKNFIDKLKAPIISQKKKIYENDPKLQLNEKWKNEEMTKIFEYNLTKQGLVLSIEYNNIKNLNEKINYNKINELLVDRDINTQKKRDVKKYETKLKALRELYINDIVKREKFMMDLVNHIDKEKNIFFDNVNKNKEKEESNKDEEKSNNN